MSKALAFIVVVLLAGCIGPAADRPTRAEQLEKVPWIPEPPLPPIPAPQAYSVAEAAPLPLVATPTETLWLYWDPSPDHDQVAHYNVWLSTNLLQGFDRIVETTELHWPLDLSRPMGFYIVNCTGTNGLGSDFAGEWK